MGTGLALPESRLSDSTFFEYLKEDSDWKRLYSGTRDAMVAFLIRRGRLPAGWVPGDAFPGEEGLVPARVIERESAKEATGGNRSIRLARAEAYVQLLEDMLEEGLHTLPALSDLAERSMAKRKFKKYEENYVNTWLKIAREKHERIYGSAPQ